jgi:hypothetical protein
MGFFSTLTNSLIEVSVCCIVGVLDKGVFFSSLHPCFRGYGVMCTLKTFSLLIENFLSLLIERQSSNHLRSKKSFSPKRTKLNSPSLIDRIPQSLKLSNPAVYLCGYW